MTNQSKQEATSNTTSNTVTPPVSPFAAFTAMGVTPEAFADFARDQAARVDQWMKDIAVYEAAVSERLKANAEQISKLAHDSMEYAAQMSAQYRKQFTDTARRVVDSIAPKA
ncbi:MAG TPA: hypothetical protein PLF40_03395 [Kofleriaceae bacterium]|nr:hypothetical protein [Kofleriaceae bacterium]